MFFYQTWHIEKWSSNLYAKHVLVLRKEWCKHSLSIQEQNYTRFHSSLTNHFNSIMCVFWRAFGVCSNIRARSHASLGSILTSIQCCKGLSGQHWINVIYFISSTRIQLKYTICKIKCFQFWIILWWMNYWSNFLNPISSDIVCLIIISIEFMSNYFEIALLKKFPNPVLFTCKH